MVNLLLGAETRPAVRIVKLQLIAKEFWPQRAATGQAACGLALRDNIFLLDVLTSMVKIGAVKLSAVCPS